MCHCIPRSRKQSKVDVMEQMAPIEDESQLTDKDDYMGLQLTEQFVKKYLPDYVKKPPKKSKLLAIMPQRMPSPTEAAAVSGWIDEESEQEENGKKEATREVVARKDDTGKIGLRIRHVKKGLYIALAHQNSPASEAGLKFGEQILKINNQEVAGWDTAKALQVLNQDSGKQISFTVKERPFQKTFTLPLYVGDSIGLVFKNGKIKSLVKKSEADYFGVPTNHQIIEVYDQSVVGVKDDQLHKMLDIKGQLITFTIMPSILYDHIVNCLGDSIMETSVDQSIPDV